MDTKKNLEDDFVTLKNIFPYIPPAGIRYIFEKCDYNLSQAIELLLKDETRKGPQSLPNNHKTMVNTPSVSKNTGRDIGVSETDSSNNFMVLNLGEAFINQLKAKFDDYSTSNEEGCQPIIQVPVKFAEQLYAYYVESVMAQTKAKRSSMLKEDEEFALKLQAYERLSADELPKKIVMRKQGNVQPPNKLSADDLVRKLMYQKLRHTFPGVEDEFLTAILEACDFDYHETISSILASDPSIRVNNREGIYELPASKRMIEEMKIAEKKAQDIKAWLSGVHSANDVREFAEKILDARNEFQKQAEFYYQKGLSDLSDFYFKLAKTQTQNFNYAHNMAAQMFVNNQSSIVDGIVTIDLHNIKFREAIPILDFCIDKELSNLQNSRKEQTYLNVITGRGKHSKDNKAILLPAVVRRLAERNMKYAFENPGMLKVVVHRGAKLTTDLNN